MGSLKTDLLRRGRRRQLQPEHRMVEGYRRGPDRGFGAGAERGPHLSAIR